MNSIFCHITLRSLATTDVSEEHIVAIFRARVSQTRNQHETGGKLGCFYYSIMKIESCSSETSAFRLTIRSYIQEDPTLLLFVKMFCETEYVKNILENKMTRRQKRREYIRNLIISISSLFLYTTEHINRKLPVAVRHIERW